MLREAGDPRLVGHETLTPTLTLTLTSSLTLTLTFNLTLTRWSMSA